MDNMFAKQSLDSHELQLLASEMDKRKKSTAATWLLWLFFGGLGGHRYYLGKIGSAIGMTLTLGGLGIWTLIDLFLISGMIRQTNDRIENEIIQDINLMRNSRMNNKNNVISKE